MFRQYKLQSNHKEIICWLQNDPNIQVGSKITIKNDDNTWVCIEKYKILLKEKPLMDWSNNI